MKVILMFLGMVGLAMSGSAQKVKPDAKVEREQIEYKGKFVKAKRLTVSSEIPMHIDSAWANVKTPALLAFVAKGMIRFKPADDALPGQWEVGQTYGVKMRLFGFMPFGGTHHLFIESIDDENYIISTNEWDRRAKIWNHSIVMKESSPGKIYYEDSIVIYGGMMTGIITSFAKRFYKHRQKRWQIVAKESLTFTG